MLSDTLWKLEQIQTLERIGATAFRYWVLRGIGLWVLSMLGVAMVTFQGTQARELVSWILASGLALTPKESMGWHGKTYDPAVLRDWLTANVYGGVALGEWGLWIAQLACVPVVLIGIVGWIRVSRKRPHEKHIRGAQILAPGELKKRLRSAGKPGIEIGGVRIPQALECSHVVVAGATGSGKTVTMRQLLRQIAKRGEPAIVMDPEGEFVSEFYDPARGDHLLNPLDRRSRYWNPWAECERPEDIEAQAASLFPITPQTGDASRYYREAARRIYADMLETMVEKDPRLIPQQIAEELGKRPNQQRGNVLSTLQIATAAFRYLEPGADGWAAREWIKERTGWCFLTYRETEKEAVLPFIALVLDSLTRRLLNAELHPEVTTWMVIDELAGLPPLITLPDLMRRGRKRGVAVCIGFQEVSGLQALYGQALTDSMLNAPSTRLLLRTNDAATQKWCSLEIGEREVMRLRENQTVGPENVRDSISRGQQQAIEAAVLASEFGTLPPLQGYLKVGHYGATRVAVQETHLVERQPAFVPRPGSPPVPEAPSPSRPGPDISPIRRTL